MFISYAQNFEDVILNRIFKDKERGFYIDVGAHHPVYDSVTKSFYDRGWQGINIEPVREFFELLQQERLRDINLQIALGGQEDTLQFFELKGTGFSTLDRDFALSLARQKNLTLLSYEVKVRTLSDICQENVINSIDFLKVDVEGWEEQVIMNNDWQVFRPSVIIIEATIPDTPIRCQTNIPNFLQAQNYQLVYFDGLNDYYLAEEASKLSCHFQTPPNVFDNFIPFKVADLLNQKNQIEQFIQARHHQITKLTNALEDRNFEIQHLTQNLIKLKTLKNEQLIYYQNQTITLEDSLGKSQEKIAEVELKLEQAYEEIAAMKTSKFWKLRQLWFRFKKLMGFSQTLFYL